MTRAVWFVAGAGAGVYAMVKARRTAEAFTPDGMHDRLAALAVGARLFSTEVRAGMAEKETQLREQMGLALDGADSTDVGELETSPATRLDRTLEDTD